MKAKRQDKESVDETQNILKKKQKRNIKKKEKKRKYKEAEIAKLEKSVASVTFTELEQAVSHSENDKPNLHCPKNPFVNPTKETNIDFPQRPIVRLKNEEALINYLPIPVSSTPSAQHSLQPKWSFHDIVSSLSTVAPLPSSIAKYLFMNEQLKGVDHGRLNPKCSLEKELDRAVENGDLALAGKLSEEISQRHYEQKVHEAIERKEFAEARQREEKARANKKQKLKWGFETKQRWETKSNM
ncbi:hypothetical protein G9A89_023932 [Geosiphon pyriformis]|nr:hypothetical protein G9A89_023932 [Geosiphon pyriformis]